MKKVLLAVVFGSVFFCANSWGAASYLQRDGNWGYQVTYDYTDKAKTGWYVGGRAELSLLNWTNKYDTDWPGAVGAFEEDKYSFEPVFGGSLFAGKRFAYFWRAELEAGYLGYFEDKDNIAEFSLSIPYMTANIYYDFINNLYVGAGVGVALPMTTLDGSFFKYEKRQDIAVAPMVALMLGYSYELDDNLVLDLRYRLSGMTGITHRVDMEEYSGTVRYFENKIDFILDNSFSIGLRYEF